MAEKSVSGLFMDQKTRRSFFSRSSCSLSLCSTVVSSWFGFEVTSCPACLPAQCLPFQSRAAIKLQRLARAPGKQPARQTGTLNLLSSLCSCLLWSVARASDTRLSTSTQTPISQPATQYTLPQALSLFVCWLVDFEVITTQYCPQVPGFCEVVSSGFNLQTPPLAFPAIAIIVVVTSTFIFPTVTSIFHPVYSLVCTAITNKYVSKDSWA